MIRSIRININYANSSKLKILDTILEESIKVVNLYIDSLWNSPNKNDKFVKTKVDTWLSARLQQCLGKQALEIVKSQRKKKKQTKPIFKFPCINLDSRFIDIEFDKNSFDIWIHLASIGNKILLNIPSKKHKLFKKYQDWKQLNFIRLLKVNNKFYIDFIYEKDITKLNTDKSIGIDLGYKKLITSSDNKIYGKELETVYTKITKKKRNSKAYKKALTERTNKTNQTINNFFNEHNDTNNIIVEDLKNVKHKSKINSKFMNKLQYWTYSRTLNRINNIAESKGINVVKVLPYYTSQQCSQCGAIDKDNRLGENFLCTACGFEIDADYNASINILHRGTYSSSLPLTKTNDIEIFH